MSKGLKPNVDRPGYFGWLALFLFTVLAVAYHAGKR